MAFATVNLDGTVMPAMSTTSYATPSAVMAALRLGHLDAIAASKMLIGSMVSASATSTGVVTTAL